ncbi:MAG: exopolyphosphatase/guanosine-5'-triphosphate,3'-diphosphate pyrophosphatase [Myxococcota bacterium]|jgi:exopolyphosphatase/guanosine-5'-triphosphate,3'-diphosphate pyrophosphatase
MRVAAIDVGTNSVHLLIVDIGLDGTVSHVEKARRQVELGSGGLGRERIAKPAFQRGLDAITEFAGAANSLGVDHITAAATSAVREASNGKEFRSAVKAHTGIHVRVVSGIEEARLIYLGVRHDLDLTDGPALLVDLGGGSVELLLAGDGSAGRPDDGVLESDSLPLGHIRVTESWMASDPIAAADIKRVKRAVRAQVAPLVKRMSAHGHGSVIGTSGAIRTLARIAAMGRGEARPIHGNGLLLTTAELDRFVKKITGKPRTYLDTLPGMDPRRQRTLPAAAVVVLEILKAFDAPGLATSARSLRDGLIQNWILRNDAVVDRRYGDAGPRERSVLGLMDRYGVDVRHATQVERFATELFDQTRSVHRLDDDDRALLSYAARLHDIGHHIDGASHNRHGEYLIQHTRMYGFTAPEITVLGQLVRYHRGPAPKRRHDVHGTLSDQDRRRVRVLAGLIRLSDALDRSHTQPVDRLTAEVKEGSVRIRAHAKAPAHVERWAAEHKRTLLSNALDREVLVEVVAPTQPSPMHDAQARNR